MCPGNPQVPKLLFQIESCLYQQHFNYDVHLVLFDNVIKITTRFAYSVKS